MTDPAILFVKPGAISADDKSALQSAGIVVVEIKNPHDAKFIRASSELSSGELLQAAAKTIGAIGEGDYGSNVKKAFATAVCAAIQAKKDI